MGWFRRGRVIPGNARQRAETYYVPDEFSIQAASLGFATNTNSPMSAGPGQRTGRFFGDPGYGVNRWDGALAYELGTKQGQAGIAGPVLDPLAQRLGLGAGVSGQPGLPSTGDQTGGLDSLARMGYAQQGWGA